MPNPTCAIPDCTNTKIMARGWCGPHYKRWYRHGNPLAPIHRRVANGATADERLRYVGWTEATRRPELGPCWEWDGLQDPKGYPRVYDGERPVFAHRLAYRTWAGPLADEQLIMHRCDNPPCVNPAHLRPGTDADNMADMANKRRSVNGERHHWHKLTDAEVAAIRAEYTGTWGQQAILAAKYGVSSGHISNLVRGLIRVTPTNPKAVTFHDNPQRLGLRTKTA